MDHEYIILVKYINKHPEKRSCDEYVFDQKTNMLKLWCNGIMYSLYGVSSMEVIRENAF